MVHGDATRLQQVAWNLLSNAVKYTGPGGTVSLWTTRTDGELEIRVSDTGQGIAPGFCPTCSNHSARPAPARRALTPDWASDSPSSAISCTCMAEPFARKAGAWAWAPPSSFGCRPQQVNLRR